MEIKRFSKWRPYAVLNFRKLQFWSRVLYWHVILYFRSKFRINRPIRHRYIGKNDFLSKMHPWNGNVHRRSKFDWNRIILGWDYGDNGIFKMAAVRHLEFAKIAVLVTRHVLACDSSSPFRNSRWSANTAPRYTKQEARWCWQQARRI